jgi:hypothetical protein
VRAGSLITCFRESDRQGQDARLGHHSIHMEGILDMGAEVLAPGQSLHSSLIAPCGMNCGLCSAYLRQRDRCAGCNSSDARKNDHCLLCRIKNCEEIRTGGFDFCFACPRFPCDRLRHLDKRYRTKYGMSMVENLRRIQSLGLQAFVALENERWKCPECGGQICVHRPACVHCGHVWTKAVAC